jgi:hypothetical protein
MTADASIPARPVDVLEDELAGLKAEQHRLQEAMGKAMHDQMQAWPPVEVIARGTEEQRRAARQRQQAADEQYDAEQARLEPLFGSVFARLAAVHARLAEEYAKLADLHPERQDGRS